MDPVPLGVFDHPPPAGSNVKSIQLASIAPATEDAYRTTKLYYRLNRDIQKIVGALL